MASSIDVDKDAVRAAAVAKVIAEQLTEEERASIVTETIRRFVESDGCLSLRHSVRDFLQKWCQAEAQQHLEANRAQYTQQIHTVIDDNFDHCAKKILNL